MKNCLLRLGFLAAAAALTGQPLSSRAADLIWTNSGVINFPPQIDAVNFFNDGTISISSLNPFETANTRNFTNSGTMISSPGWFFDTAPSGNGYRIPAENFVNLNTGQIQAVDPAGGVVIGVGGRVLLPSYLWVSATNIINRGVLGVGANGWMKLEGSTVTMNRARLDVRGIEPTGSFNDFQLGQFQPDAGIIDMYWGGTNIANPPGINTAGIWRPGLAIAPPHDVTQYPNFNGRTSWAILNPYADSYAATNQSIMITVTNLVGITNINNDPVVPGIDLTNLVVTNIFIPTNITRQAVFVGVNDPSRQFVSVSWFNSSSPTNYFKAPQIEISTLSTNVVEDVQELEYIFFADTLASTTNRGVLPNITSAANLTSYRPANYVLARMPILGFGFAGAGEPEPTFLFDRDLFTNSVVPADYAAYAAFVDYLPSELPTIPAGTVTNLPGRIQVYADSLDLRRLRIRGQGEIIIDTEHLVGSSNAVVDGPHLSFTLRSTNNNLRVVDLAKLEVARTKGPVRAWSAVWENSATFITPNYSVITNFDDTGTNIISMDATNSPVTNTAIVGLYALLFDAQSMVPTLPVTVWDFVTHSRAVTVEDAMTVVQKFYMDAEDFTLNGSISLSNTFWTTSIGSTFFAAVPDWTATNTPNLRNFTNNGYLRVPNEIHLGDDRPSSLNSYVNDGTIVGSSLSVKSEFFQDSGALTIGGAFRLWGGTGILNGSVMNVGNAQITSENLRLNSTRVTATDLVLDVSGVLADAGSTANNSISVVNGFHLGRRPVGGDLLGTTFRSVLPNWLLIDHTWAGVDRGASAAGFENNLALGGLTIIGGTAKDPLAFFKGVQPGSALYVDVLDLSDLADNWDDFIDIAPDFTIYYGAVRVGFTPPSLPNGVAQTPEEYLDGQFGGRLRWVRDYAGAGSSVAVAVNGATVFMNAGLRNSQVIDSDQDGVPNYFDATPLGGSTPASVAAITLKPALASFTNPNLPNQPVQNAFSVTWTAAPNTAYQIEVATDLVQGDWQPLSLYTNNTLKPQTATISDTNMPSFSQRFYRVRAK